MYADLTPEEASRRAVALRELVEHPGWELFRAMLSSEVKMNLQKAGSVPESHRSSVFTGCAVLASNVADWPVREYQAMMSFIKTQK